MKKIGMVASALALVALASVAEAGNQPKPQRIYNPYLYCHSFDFEARGGGARFYIGHFELNGSGRFQCREADTNKRIDILVKIKMGGRPLANEIAAGYFVLEGHGQSHFEGYAADLHQRYFSGGSKVAWGIGLSKQAMRISSDRVELELTLRPLRGVGFEIGFQEIEIIPYAIDTTPENRLD